MYEPASGLNDTRTCHQFHAEPATEKLTLVLYLADMTTSDEDTQVNLFCAFLEDQDRGFEGTFADWTKTVLGDREEAYPLLDWFEMEVPDEDVRPLAPEPHALQDTRACWQALCWYFSTIKSLCLIPYFLP